MVKDERLLQREHEQPWSTNNSSQRHLWPASSGSWQAHLKGHKRISRSWAVAGGHTDALHDVVSSCWRLWLDDNGSKTTQCPVEGMFKLTTPAEAAEDEGEGLLAEFGVFLIFRKLHIFPFSSKMQTFLDRILQLDPFQPSRRISIIVFF